MFGGDGGNSAGRARTIDSLKLLPHLLVLEVDLLDAVSPLRVCIFA
jgi:hypothetical protein